MCGILFVLSFTEIKYQRLGNCWQACGIVHASSSFHPNNVHGSLHFRKKYGTGTEHEKKTRMCLKLFEFENVLIECIDSLTVCLF